MTHRLIHILITLPLALLLTGCSDDTTVDGGAGTQTPLRFSADVNVPAETRSGVTGEMNLTALKEQASFGVYAYYTESTKWADYTSATEKVLPGFLYNQEVKWNQSYWEYSPLKYWPNGEGAANDVTGTGATQHYVTFYGYAPYAALGTIDTGDATDPTDDTSYGITAITGSRLSGTGTFAPSIDFTLSTTQSVDLLWAKREVNGLSLTDMTKQTVDGTVPMAFQHALACIEVYVQRVYNEDYNTSTDITDGHTKIFVGNLRLAGSAMSVSGTLNLSDGSWTSSGSGTLDYTLDKDDMLSDVGGTDATNSSPGEIRSYELDKYATATGVDATVRQLSDQVLMFIPGSVTLTPYVTYSFVTQDNTLAFETIADSDGNLYGRRLNSDRTSDGYTMTLDAGKKYKLLVKIGVNGVALELVGVEDWDFPLRFSPTVTEPTGTTEDIIVKEE